MTDQTPLRRKIGASSAPSAPAITAERLWIRAMSHGFSRGLGAEVRVLEAAQAPIMPEDCDGLAEEGMILLLLDGPAGYGAALVEAPVTSAVIEQQTLGRIRARALRPRPPTATDAAMLADPLDRIFKLHEAMAEEMPPPRPMAGMRFATRIAEPHEIRLHLADAWHDHWRIGLGFGAGGARSGAIHLILPRAVAEPAAAESGAGDWSRRFEGRLLGSEIPLRAELGRLTLSAEEVRALKAGDVLPMARQAIGRVRLVGPQESGVVTGRLGQSGGMKAVRVEGPSEEPFIPAPERGAALSPAPPSRVRDAEA